MMSDTVMVDVFIFYLIGSLLSKYKPENPECKSTTGIKKVQLFNSH